jgi:hypothetical protein
MSNLTTNVKTKKNQVIQQKQVNLMNEGHTSMMKLQNKHSTVQFNKMDEVQFETTVDSPYDNIEL